jgi:uncharacterized protein involved in type VI secretion and phage assembly
MNYGAQFDDALANRQLGVATAVVVDHGDPRHMGEVRVRYPWWGSDAPTRWTRVATPMAGPDRGMYFLPQKGDEVLVAFEHADFDHPVVVGGLWNGDQKSPYATANGPNDVRAIRSRRGHEIRFDDSDENAHLTLTTNAGNRVVLDDKRDSERLELTSSDGANRVVLDASGTVEIVGGKSLELSAPSVNVTADTDMTLDGGARLTLTAGQIDIN